MKWAHWLCKLIGSVKWAHWFCGRNLLAEWRNICWSICYFLIYFITYLDSVYFLLIDFDEQEEVVQGACWSLDGSLIATTSKDRLVRMFDPRSNGTGAVQVIWFFPQICLLSVQRFDYLYMQVVDLRFSICSITVCHSWLFWCGLCWIKQSNRQRSGVVKTRTNCIRRN